MSDSTENSNWVGLLAIMRRTLAEFYAELAKSRKNASLRLINGSLRIVKAELNGMASLRNHYVKPRSQLWRRWPRKVN